MRLVAEFLAHLDDRVVRQELDRHYKVLPGTERYPRTAMFKAFIWRKVIEEESLLAFHRHLEDNPTITSKAYAGKVKISHPVAVADLNDLVTRGLLRKVGKTRGAYYELADGLNNS